MKEGDTIKAGREPRSQGDNTKTQGSLNNNIVSVEPKVYITHRGGFYNRCLPTFERSYLLCTFSYGSYWVVFLFFYFILKKVHLGINGKMSKGYNEFIQYITTLISTSTSMSGIKSPRVHIGFYV